MLMNGAFRLIGVEISVIVVLSDEFSSHICTIEIYNIEMAEMRIAAFRTNECIDFDDLTIISY